MPALRADVDPAGDRVVVRLFGDLWHRDGPEVRSILAKCLAGQPRSVVVDLAGVEVREPLALAVFASVAGQAATWPGASIMLCTPDPALFRLLAKGAYGRLPVFAGPAEALAADPGHGTPAVSDVLLPVSGAARHARVLAADVCDRWGLPHLAPTTALIATELVTNAVVHARTMMDLRFSRGHRYLLIAVRDGSAAPPRTSTGPDADPATGRGLSLVESLALRWGSFPAAGGKVVWAALARS